jgi:hypothetical protein
MQADAGSKADEDAEMIAKELNELLEQTTAAVRCTVLLLFISLLLTWATPATDKNRHEERGGAQD